MITINMAAAIYNSIEAREIAAEVVAVYGSRSVQLYDAISLNMQAEAAVNAYGDYGRRMAQLRYANVWD